MAVSARLALLRDLPPPGHSGPRIRVVGRVIGVDLASQVVLIQDEQVGLVVTLAPINDFADWAPKLKDLVMIAGDLCQANGTFPIPTNYAVDPPKVKTSCILVAVWIKPCEELDLPKWREAVQATFE